MFLIAVFLIFVAAAEIDICVPSFPEIAGLFQTSPFKTELLLGLNLFFHCIASFFVGNLGDKYGKKQVMLIGMIIFTLGSVVCTISNSYYLLLFARCIQGIGAATTMVLAPLVVMHHYSKDRRQKMMSIFNGITTISLCFAPTMGSYVALYFGWRGNFTLLTFFGIIGILVVIFGVKSGESRDSNVKISLKEYLPILKCGATMRYIFALCLSIGVYYTFIAMAPLVYIEEFGVSLHDFGTYQGVLTFTFGVLSIVNHKIVAKIGKKVAFYSSSALICLFVILCTFATIFNLRDPFYITCIVLTLTVGVVYPMNMIYTLALDSMEGASGRISGIINAGRWIFSILGFQLASYFYTDNFRSTGVVMVIFDIISIAFVIYMYVKDRQFKLAINNKI